MEEQTQGKEVAFERRLLFGFYKATEIVKIGGMSPSFILCSLKGVEDSFEKQFIGPSKPFDEGFRFFDSKTNEEVDVSGLRNFDILTMYPGEVIFKSENMVDDDTFLISFGAGMYFSRKEKGKEGN
jgi:hypothetical protein